MIIRMPFRLLAGGFDPLIDGLVRAPSLRPTVHKDCIVGLRRRVVELPRFRGRFRACVSNPCLMVVLVGYGRVVSQRRIPALRIVPPLDVFENGSFCVV